MRVVLGGCKDGGDKTEDNQGSERDRVKWSKSLQEPKELLEPISGKPQAGKAGERGHVPRESRDLCLTAETTISTSFPSLLEKMPSIQRSGQAGTSFEKRQNLPSRGNASGKGELSLDEFPSIVFHPV